MAPAFCRARRGNGEEQRRLSHAFSGVGSAVESLSDYMPPMPRGGRQGRGGGAGTEEGTLITWIIIDFPWSTDGTRTIYVTKRHRALVFSKVILASKNSDHTTSSGMLKKSILDVSHEIPMPRY